MPWLPWWPDATPGRAASRNSRPPEDVAESFMRRMVGDRIWERLPAATRAQRRAEGPALVAEMLALNSGVLWDPTTIGIPVVVGRGGTSSERHRRAAQDLAAALPRGQLVDVEGANHGAHLSHPRVMAELLHRAAEAMPLVRTDPS
jgi:pimeloyl-ACP methyl ester carboxylesterase